MAANLVLDTEERNKLVTILCKVPDFASDVEGRKTFAQAAGLGRFVDGMDWAGADRAVAGALVGVLNEHGFLRRVPGDPAWMTSYHAVGRLLVYLLTEPSVGAEDAAFLATLIVRYGLVRDPTYIAGLRSQYSIAEQPPPRGRRPGNPYWNRRSIRVPGYFFGRSYEVQSALTLLANTQNISVVGPRRIGKSSLLYHVSEPTVLKDYAIDPEQFAFIFVSCEQLSELSRDEIQNVMLSQARSALSKAGHQIDSGGSSVADLTSFEFSNELGRLAQLGRKLIFLLDEFEALAQNRSLTPVFFDSLRSIANNLDVAYVTTSGRDLQELTYVDKSALVSPFFNVFSTIRLGLFTDSDARQLINEPSRTAGVEFSDETVDFILSLADHHPLFIQIGCFHAFEMQSQKGRLTDADYPLLRERVKSEGRGHLEYAWKQLGDKERQALLHLDKAWEDPKLESVRMSLEEQGILCPSDNRYRLCTLWADFVNSQREGITGPKTIERASLGDTTPGPVAAVVDDRPKTRETYKDFELHISPEGRVTARSEEGASPSVLLATQVSSAIRSSLDLIEERQTDAEQLKQVGRDLYDWLFPGPIHTHFQQTDAVARSKKAKVRLRLRIEVDDIASLPIEFVYRDLGGYYLALNPDTALSRYLDLPSPPERVRRRKGALHMLAIIADPNDLPRLPPDEWEVIMQKALAAPLASGQMTLRTVKRATWKEIRDALLLKEPDIIQFVGHGFYKGSTGHLALVDGKTGSTWSVDDEQFANLYLGHDDHLGLISLATCESAKTDDPQGFSGIAPKLVQRGVPAVLAMQYKVYVDTAKVFLEEFYGCVAARKPIDWATQSARNAVSVAFGLDNREFATPVLYMRAQDGNVF